MTLILIIDSLGCLVPSFQVNTKDLRSPIACANFAQNFTVIERWLVSVPFIYLVD